MKRAHPSAAFWRLFPCSDCGSAWAWRSGIRFAQIVRKRAACRRPVVPAAFTGGRSGTAVPAAGTKGGPSGCASLFQRREQGCLWLSSSPRFERGSCGESGSCGRRIYGMAGSNRRRHMYVASRSGCVGLVEQGWHRCADEVADMLWHGCASSGCLPDRSGSFGCGWPEVIGFGQLRLPVAAPAPGAAQGEGQSADQH